MIRHEDFIITMVYGYNTRQCKNEGFFKLYRIYFIKSNYYTLSGRTGSALVWHTRGRWFVIIIIIIIIKKYRQCKAGRGRLTPYQSEDPSHTLPTYRGKEEKNKLVEAKKGESN